MKILQLCKGLLLLLGVTIFWIACQKEISHQPAKDERGTQSQKASGAVPDDPKLVSKVPLSVSADFLMHGSTVSNSILLSSSGGKRRPNTDVIPPTVSIISPSNGGTVSGTIDVPVNAADNIGVSSVSLKVDSTIIGTLGSPPYSFTWDGTKAGDGTHILTATAKDAVGNSSSYTIAVAVNTVITVLPQPSLPGAFQLITPPVGNQGNEGSCAPFATVYASRSIEQYYRTGATSYSYSTNIFSPEYVYDQTKFSGCLTGTAITTTLDLMKNKGVCTWETLPYSDANGCDSSITTPYDGAAANFKITSYSKILKIDSNAIKTMLNMNHPVIISLIIDDLFTNATPGFIWKTAGTGNIGHSVIICGYDDAMHAYKVMNSWGTSWGDAGYSWIDYDYFLQVSGYYAYVMNY